MIEKDGLIQFGANEKYIATGICKDLPEWTLIECFEKMTPAKLGKQQDCTGCGTCANICNN